MSSDQEEFRPAIWSEGSQKPPFEPRAFARMALKIGRETVAGILARCGSSAEGVGGELRAGRLRIPEDRLGRTGRYLPSAETTSRAVFGGAEILRRAAEVAQPNAHAWTDTPAEIDGAYRDLFREGARSAVDPSAADNAVAASAAPRRAVPAAAPAAGKGDPDQLASIRAILNSAGSITDVEGAAMAVRPGRAAAPADERRFGAGEVAAPPEQSSPELPALPLSARLIQWAKEGAARVLGYWMIAFVIPYGALRAGIAHLNGEDLRKAHKSE